MPVKEWRPTDRQAEFLSVPDSVFEALYGGAAGGGKTECLLSIPVVKKTKDDKPLYTHPKYKCLYLRRTFPELEQEIIPRSRTFYEPAGGVYKESGSKRRWEFPSGAIVQFGHAEHEKDVRNYDTAEYTNILWDEVTSFTPFQYSYLTFSRCRTSSPDLLAYSRSASNPGNIGHSYHKKRFIDPCRSGGAILKEKRIVNGKEQTLLRIFIPSKLQDNPHLLTNDPGYEVRLNKLPEKERKAKADGDWYTYSGQVFGNFRFAKVPGEPDNAIHVIDPFKIPDYWAVILSIDWGYSAMMIAGWYAINPVPDKKFPAKIYKCHEYSAYKTNISKWAKDIGIISRQYNLADAVLDPSAWAHRGDDFTIAEQAVAHSGINFRKADNDRLGGKLLIQEYLRWEDNIVATISGKYNPVVAHEIYSNGGAVALKRYEESFQDARNAVAFLPQFQIFNTCDKTIETLPMCNYKQIDAKSVDPDEDCNSEDVEEFRGDDPYDETRYGLKACQFYLGSGKTEYDHLQKISNAISKLEISGNTPSAMTQFYINMGNIETQGLRAKRPIRRFHGTGLRHANF